ncbi:MAG: RNA polymerase sigma factor SigJ [bacterium]
MELKERSEIFLRHRGALMGLAYRMLGSLSEAEDAVQDTYLRWREAEPTALSDAKAWLMKVCSRRCIDQLRKAYRQRESYVGTWLPDPLPNAFRPWVEPVCSPAALAETSENLSIAFLLLLEKLSPMERAVFLLHDVFQYSFGEVAAFVDGTEGQCRKAGQRARAAIQRDRPRFDAPGADAYQVMERFFSAARNGEEATLQELLATGSEFWSDGGGKVAAANRVLDDTRQIAHFFAGLGRLALRQGMELRWDFTLVNNRPGLLLAKRGDDGQFHLETVFSFEFQDRKISRIFAMRNPEKLSHLTEASPDLHFPSQEG